MKALLCFCFVPLFSSIPSFFPFFLRGWGMYSTLLDVFFSYIFRPNRFYTFLSGPNFFLYPRVKFTSSPRQSPRKDFGDVTHVDNRRPRLSPMGRGGGQKKKISELNELYHRCCQVWHGIDNLVNLNKFYFNPYI